MSGSSARLSPAVRSADSSPFVRDETESRIVAAVTVSGARQCPFHEGSGVQTVSASVAGSGPETHLPGRLPAALIQARELPREDLHPVLQLLCIDLLRVEIGVAPFE